MAAGARVTPVLARHRMTRPNAGRSWPGTGLQPQIIRLYSLDGCPGNRSAEQTGHTITAVR
jgi:hypothetical protein